MIILLFASLAVILSGSLLLFKMLHSRERKIQVLLSENKKLLTENQKLNNLSMTDALTGLMNRRAMGPIIINEINRTNRYKTPVSLLILDLDHFKRINDNYGHDLGDKVLQSLAEGVISICRKTDHCARWGGEEFIVLASETTGLNALVLAEKIRCMVEKMNLLEQDILTVSIGVSTYHRGESFEEWFNRSDEALYQAKDTGRNRICLHRTDLTEESNDGFPNNMLRLEWKNEYSAGIEDIDFRHQELFYHSNRIMDSVLKNEEVETVFSSLESMLDIVTSHFDEEEKILREMLYPQLVEHRAEHQKLVEQLSSLIVLFREKEADPIMLLNYFSRDLIQEHVINRDREYSYINKRK